MHDAFRMHILEPLKQLSDYMFDLSHWQIVVFLYICIQRHRVVLEYYVCRVIALINGKHFAEIGMMKLGHDFELV